MKNDIEKLWDEIDSSFDEDENLDFQSYFQSKSWIPENSLESASENINQLLTSAFSGDEDLCVSVSSKYKIIRKIDSGGQSDVYLAERNDGIYQQQVVIKFISNNYKSSILKEQFLQEMQLLADLSHPGVVPIIDADVTQTKDGTEQPWLVLEYISGQHIDEYCSTNKLRNRDIAKLIISLCDTLDFVHQRGIIHKDIKPSNILIKPINNVPYPVLIDFGIAQEQTDKDNNQLIFATYGYSSPEQVQNNRPDHRSDIYSLGVVLFQLLSGKDEFDIKKFNENRKQSILKSDIPKDLKEIVLKCVQKNPQQRYDSVAMLRNDLNNWLMDFPLSFNNNKLSHIFVKSIKRNKFFSALLAIIFISGIYFAVKYTSDIKYQQSLTIKEKNATDQLMNFMLNDLYENLVKIGRVDVLKQVVDKSINHLNVQENNQLSPQGYLQSATAYINAGRVYDQLEQSTEANQAFLQALKNLEKYKSENTQLTEYYNLLSRLSVYHSQVLSSEGQEVKTEETLKTAVESSKEYLLLNPHGDKQFLSEAYLEQGYYYLEYGKPELAIQAINNNLQLCQQMLENEPNSANWLYNSSHALQLKSWYEIDFGSLQQGINDLKKAIIQGKHAIEIDAKDLRKMNNIRILHNQLSFFYLEDGKHTEGLETAKKALEYGLNLESQAPLNKEYKRELSYTYSTLGEIYQQLQDSQNALLSMEKGLQISRENYQRDPENFSVANDLCIDLLLVAEQFKTIEQNDKFSQLSNEALKIIQHVTSQEPNNKYYRHTYATALLMLEQFDEARPHIQFLNQAGMLDETIKSLLNEKQLSDWLGE